MKRQYHSTSNCADIGARQKSNGDNVCVWSFHRIALIHIESVMYISYYRQYPAYCMPLILCYWKILNNMLYINIDIIKYNNAPVCFFLWRMRCSAREHSSTARGGYGGGGVFYLKLINKTSWQEHCFCKFRVLWSLRYAKIRP